MQGTTAPKIATEAMEAGIRLQKPVADWWADRSGRKIRACPWTYELEPGVGSHYDYDLVDEKAILEVKTAGAYAARDFGEENTEQIPEAYALQVAHEMACRPGIERAYLAVLVGGQKLRSYVVERDENLIEDLLTVERRFLSNARAGIPPPMDGSEAASNFLRLKSPRDNGERVELTEPVEALALAYLSAREQEKAVAEQKDTIANKLREALGDTALATGKMVKVSFKSSKDTDWVDWRACAETTASDEIIAKFTSTKLGNRPLIVTALESA
jgi:predicted phage-related endonuclease